MNTPWIAAALLLTACSAQHRLPAETEYPATVVGRVAKRTVAGSSPIAEKENPTAITQTPHSSIPIVTSSGEVIRVRPRIAYELRANDGTLLIVQATSDFPVGACVALSGYADGPSRTHFSFGRAALEPSDQCDAQPVPGEPRRMLTGMFIYMADAAVITLCADGGRLLPVAMEADYKALEAAYLRERPQPGQALLVSLEGRIAPRPSMEVNQPPRPNVVVERFINIWPRETCGNPLVDSPLRGTYWKLVRLNEAPVRVAETQREPHLIFANYEPRVSGSGGCNRVTGSFELDGDKLHLGRMAGTMMACVDGMEQEQRFLQSLEKVERYRISGSHLEMLGAAGTVIARFEAVALR